MKKTISLLLALVLALGAFAGCGKNYETVLTVDGEAIPAGIYLIAQLEAYGLAQQELGDTSADVLKETVEEKDGGQWVYDQAVALCQRYVYVERAFDELGLTIDDAQRAALDAGIENGWGQYSAYYEANGVGRASYQAYYENNYKLGQLFETQYVQIDGGQAVTNEEAMAYMDENYVQMEYIVLPLISYTDFTPLGDEGVANITAVAQDMVQALADGTDAQQVITTYLPLAYTMAGNQELDVSTPANFLTDTYVQKGSASYDEAFVDNLFALEKDQWSVLQPSSSYLWVARRGDNYTDQADFENYRSNIVYAMRNEAFYSDMEVLYSAYEVAADQNAVNYYSPKNITTGA